MKATEEIWFEYHEKLYNFIRKRVDEDIAEDILQDVFLKIHRKLDGLQENRKLESWLYQITRNTVIDYYRSKRPTESLPEWIAEDRNEEDETVAQELSCCLIPLIEELPTKYRVAVELADIERKNQKEVAALENISISGAKSRVQRGRAMLKSMLHDCCVFETNHNQELISYEPKEVDCKLCK